MWNCSSFRTALLVLVGVGLSPAVLPEAWFALACICLGCSLLCARRRRILPGIGGRGDTLAGFLSDVAVVAALLAAVGFYAGTRIENEVGPARVHRERVSTVAGTVVGFPETTLYGTRLVLKPLSGDGRRLGLGKNARVLAKVRRALQDLSHGDTLWVTGILRDPRERRNPGGFDEAGYMFQHGAQAVLEVPAFVKPVVHRSKIPAFPMASHVGPVRNWVRRAVERHVPGEEGAFLLALLLGERGQLTKDTKTSFRDSGIIHLLAVSGLHTALIGLVALIFLRGSRLSIRTATIGSVAAVWFYCLVSGFHPSTLRASVMVSCCGSSRLTGRSAELLSPLSTSCVLLVLANPKYVWDPGFQLSYAATFSILAAAPLKQALKERFRRHERLWNYVFSPGLTTFLAQLGVLPILAVHFGSFSLVALPANLVAVPLVSTALVSALSSLAVCAVMPAVAQIPFALCWFLLRLSTLVAGAASSFPWASTELAKPGWEGAVGFLVCLFVLLGCVGRKQACGRGLPGEKSARIGTKNIPAIAAALGVCLMLAWFLGILPCGAKTEGKCVRVSFLDVGQGDAAVVELPDGRLILIDGGESNEKWDSSERVLIPFLREVGRRNFGLAVITHFHSDHAGGILPLLERGKVKELIVTPADTLTALSRSSRALASKKHVAVRSVSRPDTLVAVEGIEMVVTHPAGSISIDTSSASLNDSSVVTVLRSGRIQFVFTGDVGTAVMDVLAGRIQRRPITVLKAPHHGSKLSLSERFVEALDPDHVVFSAGRNNRFGHPSPEVVSAYRRAGARTYSTAADGCVSFAVCGDSVTVATAETRGRAGRLEKMRARRWERFLRLILLASPLQGPASEPQASSPLSRTCP